MDCELSDHKKSVLLLNWSTYLINIELLQHLEALNNPSYIWTAL